MDAPPVVGYDPIAEYSNVLLPITGNAIAIGDRRAVTDDVVMDGSSGAGDNAHLRPTLNEALGDVAAGRRLDTCDLRVAIGHMCTSVDDRRVPDLGALTDDQAEHVGRGDLDTNVLDFRPRGSGKLDGGGIRQAFAGPVGNRAVGDHDSRTSRIPSEAFEISRSVRTAWQEDSGVANIA